MALGEDVPEARLTEELRYIENRASEIFKSRGRVARHLFGKDIATAFVILRDAIRKLMFFGPKVQRERVPSDVAALLTEPHELCARVYLRRL